MPTAPKPDRPQDSLADQVAACRRAADGDSNDEEIEALQFALDEALRQLGRDDLRE